VFQVISVLIWREEFFTIFISMSSPLQGIFENALVFNSNLQCTLWTEIKSENSDASGEAETSCSGCDHKTVCCSF